MTRLENLVQQTQVNYNYNMTTSLNFLDFITLPLLAPFLLSEEDENASVPDRAIPSKKDKDEKPLEPQEIELEDITGFPRADEKAENPDSQQEKRIEEAL